MKTENAIEIFNLALLDNKKSEADIIAILTEILSDNKAKAAEIINNKFLADGNTPLHYAAKSGKIKLVKFLINNGADETIKNKFGQSAEDVAVSNQVTFIQGRVANFLLKKLNLALYPDTKETAQYLKLLRTEKESKKALQGFMDSATLDYKIFKEAVTQLIKEMSILSKAQRKKILDSCTDKDGNVALHLAARRGDLELAVLLTKNGASIHIENKDKKNPDDLARANQRTYLGFIRNALTLGYAGIKNTQPVTDLIEVERIKEDASKRLAEILVDPSKQKTDKELSDALRNVYDSMVGLSTETVKEVFEVRDDRGNTLLHLVAQKGFIGSFTLLSKSGLRADTLKNQEGKTPLELVPDSKKKSFEKLSTHFIEKSSPLIVKKFREFTKKVMVR